MFVLLAVFNLIGAIISGIMLPFTFLTTPEQFYEMGMLFGVSLTNTFVFFKLHDMKNDLDFLKKEQQTETARLKIEIALLKKHCGLLDKETDNIPEHIPQQQNVLEQKKI